MISDDAEATQGITASSNVAAVVGRGRTLAPRSRHDATVRGAFEVPKGAACQ